MSTLFHGPESSRGYVGPYQNTRELYEARKQNPESFSVSKLTNALEMEKPYRCNQLATRNMPSQSATSYEVFLLLRKKPYCKHVMFCRGIVSFLHFVLQICYLVVRLHVRTAQACVRAGHKL